MKEQRYLLFPVDPKTHKPHIDSIAVFPNMGEALKAKAFLKRSGMLVIILPIAMVESKEEFCELWKTRAISAMLGTLGITTSVDCATSASKPHS